MSLTSITFLFYFLPLCLPVYLALMNTRCRNVWLLVTSIVFYVWSEPAYFWLLLVSVLINYCLGRLIGSATGNIRRWLLWTGVIVNLAGLFICKYVSFSLATLAFVLHAPNLLNLVPALPLALGVSFFTFKAISYLVDVYRKDAVPSTDIVEVALYLMMFPQILAGPIARFPETAAELRSRTVTLSNFRRGAERFLIGMAQKILIANQLAVPVDLAFSSGPADLSCPVAWFGAFCYTLQIYFDFAGYTNMAIGLGLMMGFSFPENFRYPYSAQSITEFWQRWHITLTQWLRDYLWFPLGANRRGKRRTYVNLLLLFGACGLWHGASLTFVVWGLYHGTLLAVERAGFLKLLAKWPRPLRAGYVLLMTMLGWVFFRANSLPHAVRVLATMAGLMTAGQETVWRFMTPDILLPLAAGVFFSFPPLHVISAGTGPVRRAAWRIVSATALFVISLISLFALAEGSHNAFLYARF